MFPEQLEFSWSLCHDVYKTANWAKCYSTTLNPVNISTLVPLPNIKPPVPKNREADPKEAKEYLEQMKEWTGTRGQKMLLLLKQLMVMKHTML